MMSEPRAIGPYERALIAARADLDQIQAAVKDFSAEIRRRYPWWFDDEPEDE